MDEYESPPFMLILYMDSCGVLAPGGGLIICPWDDGARLYGEEPAAEGGE